MTRRAVDAEVVVVGAGPAGSWTAQRLAELGHEVILADENPGPREEVVCTGIVGEEAFDLFDLPTGPVVDVVARARFVSPAGVEVPYEPEGGMARVLDRTRFDGALAERAVEAGAELLRSHAARRLGRRDGRVVVTFRTPEGERKLGARVAVVATGHMRWLHEGAGLGTPERYVHGVHADLPFRDLDAAELYFGNRVAPGFFAWAVPYGRGTARLGVLSEQGSRAHFEDFLHLPCVRERLGVDLGDGGLSLVRDRLRSRGIVQGPVEPSYADGVVAVGEAAGQVKTTTAGGIYYGILGAETAAEVLHDALVRDRTDARALAPYERAWYRKLGREIDMGLRLQRAVADMEDERIDHLFEALRDGVGSVVRRAVSFDWHEPALRALFRADRARRYLSGAVDRITKAS